MPQPTSMPIDTAFHEVLPSGDLLALLASPRPPRSALLSSLHALQPSEVPALLRRTAFHRIDGLAHRVIAGLPLAEIQPWLRASLQRRHQRIAAATLSQGLALGEVLEGLRAAGVPTAVMRGVRAAEAIYRDPGARPFDDHDLLVRPSSLAAARRVLGRHGFQEVAPGLHRRGGMLIDLHTDPLGARRRPTRDAVHPIGLEALFDRSVPGHVAGAPASLLAIEDELILMGIHLVKHSFDRLIRIADLAHLIAAHGGGIQWEAVWRIAESWRATRLVGWALDAAALLGTPRPAGFIHGDAGGGWIETVLLRRAYDLRPVPYTGEILMALAAPSWSQRMSFLVDALLPAGEIAGGRWRRAARVPQRSVALLWQAAWQVAARRNAR